MPENNTFVTEAELASFARLVASEIREVRDDLHEIKGLQVALCEFLATEAGVISETQRLAILETAKAVKEALDTFDSLRVLDKAEASLGSEALAQILAAINEGR